MKIIADLHIHSKYSRATSKNLDLQNLEKYARIKGVNLLGTGDFTHPVWFKELKDNLTEDGSGILKSKTGFDFLLTVELSNIY
jgi:PHP family Zn ribbon phosphoesterase